MQLGKQRGLSYYLTLNNLINLLFVSVALIEFYQPANLFAEAGGKKSKKYVVVKEVGKTYKKVPIYKKVPVKVYKVVFKKKKSEKPWKKWFKKQMIVKIPQEHKKHHDHHHAATEPVQSWTLPAFIATPSSMGDIFDAWPADYKQSSSSSQSASNNQQVHSQQPPTSISDLKSIGSEEYPAFLAAAAQLVNNQFALQDQQQQYQVSPHHLQVSEPSFASSLNAPLVVASFSSQLALNQAQQQQQQQQQQIQQQQQQQLTLNNHQAQKRLGEQVK